MTTSGEALALWSAPIGAHVERSRSRWAQAFGVLRTYVWLPCHGCNRWRPLGAVCDCATSVMSSIVYDDQLDAMTQSIQWALGQSEHEWRKLYMNAPS